MPSKQIIAKGKDSICPNCVHTGLCRLEANQPCVSCTGFMDTSFFQLSSSAKAMLQNLADDTTCPIHIAAEIEQILGMVENQVQDGNWISVKKRLPKDERKNYIAEMNAAGTLDVDLYPCLVVKAAPEAPAKRIIKKAWFDGCGFIHSYCIHITRTVTHWAPIPDLPPLAGH